MARNKPNGYYHINKSNESGPCSADPLEGCPFYDESNTDNGGHYTKEEAEAKSQELLANEFGTAPKKNVRYSFMKEFKEQEEQFEKDYDGFPNRFWNADVRGKTFYHQGELDEDTMLIVNTDFDPETEDLTEQMAYALQRNLMSRARTDEVATRLSSVLSSPQDAKLTGEEVVELAKNLGIEDTVEVTEERMLRAMKTDKAWVGEIDGRNVIITSANQNSKNFNGYSFRFRSEQAPGSFMYLDARSLVGATRAHRRTGINLVETVRGADLTYEERKRNALNALAKIESDQFEGSNFIAQKKRIKETSGSVATAWMDKKNPDKTRQAMMKDTVLNNYFRKVEIDNDVDPEEYKNFEEAYQEVHDRLPKMPGDRHPELKIRKLGKHKADGVYFPHKNILAVDVRNSSAFIHEYGHALDFAAFGNASLHKEFREVSKGYNRELHVPDNNGKKRDYYTTPTEQMARLFELYSHERLGVDNRLVDTSRFEHFDYKPFTDNPDLKERGFAFFDKLFADAK